MRKEYARTVGYSEFVDGLSCVCEYIFSSVSGTSFCFDLRKRQNQFYFQTYQTYSSGYVRNKFNRKHKQSKYKKRVLFIREPKWLSILWIARVRRVRGHGRTKLLLMEKYNHDCSLAPKWGHCTKFVTFKYMYILEILNFTKPFEF